MSQSKELLAHILGCGICDVEMLDDMEADVFDIIDEINDCDATLSLEHIFSIALDKAKCKLKESVRERVPEIKRLLEDYIEFDDDGEKDLPDELYEVAEKFGYGYMETDDYPGAARKDLAALDEIDADNDVSMYFNFLDSHICFDNQDVWFRFFKDELDELERYVGLSICNR